MWLFFLFFLLLFFPNQLRAIDDSFVIPQPSTQTKEPVNYITSNQSLQVLIARANQLFLQGQYEKALDPLMQAYEKAPKNIRVNNMLGSIFYKLKNYQLARYYWGKSLSLDGKQEMVRSYLNQIRASN